MVLAINGSAVNGGEICADEIGADAVNNGAVHGGASDGDVGGAGYVMDALHQSHSRINFVRTKWVFHDQGRVLVHLFRHQQCKTGLDLAQSFCPKRRTNLIWLDGQPSG